jgi:uncharacterized MAPEG superfamily protein
MTVALWCILIALVLPPLCALIAKVSSGASACGQP